jgi:hypothetical protein
LWDSISLLAFVQLPMRLRGLVALCLAPLVGVAMTRVPPRGQLLGAICAIILLVLSALPMLYPRYARDIFWHTTLNEMFALEERTGALGTTSFGEYLPVWVQDIPHASPFPAEYARGDIPNRFVLPQGVSSCGAEIERLTQRVCVSSPVAWRAIFRAFYFPGWRVTIDNVVVAPRPNTRDGLVTFDVPAGEHTLQIEYAGTSVENLAGWISLAGALVVAGVLVFAAAGARRPRSVLRRPSSVVPPPFSVLIPLFLVAFAFCAFKFFYADRISNPWVAHFDGARVENIAEPRRVQFGAGMELLGFDADAQVKRGDTLHATLYWRALPALAQDLSAFVHLTAADGFVLAQKDNLHPANLPTTRWELDAYAADVHDIAIPPDLAPGEYELRAGIYDPQTNTRLKTPDGADYVLLKKIRVTGE